MHCLNETVKKTVTLLNIKTTKLMRAKINYQKQRSDKHVYHIDYSQALLSKDFVDTRIGSTLLYTKLATIHLTFSLPHFIAHFKFSLKLY